MRLSRLLVPVLIVGIAASARALETETIGGAVLGPAVLPAGQVLRVTSGQALVRLSSGTTTAQLDAGIGAVGAARGADLGGGWHLIHLAVGQSVAAALPMLRALPGVASADPSRVYSANRTPNDPSVNSQYALAQVSAFAGWEYEVGNSSRVTIAVIDTGIDGTHPDLIGKRTNTVSKAFDPNTGVMTANDPPTPACNHATHVAGVAAASTDNGTQVAGMSWGAQLLSLKVFTNASCPSINCTDAGCLTNDAGIIAAINHAVTLQNTAAVGKVVINMSLGGAGACPGAVQTAITNAVLAGVPVIVAAGNDGGAVNNPGNCAGVIPVGATDSNNNVAAFSSRGAELAANGLVAPGVSLLTTDEGGGTASATGTSFAAPMVSGLAALILSAKPAFTVAQVSAAIRGGADAIGVAGYGVAGLGTAGTTTGAGRMDAYRSMRLAVKGTLAGFDGEQKPIAFPNPFKPSTSSMVNFAIPPSLQGGQLSIKIYTIDGAFGRTVMGLSWDG
ncbi:MAG: S8 family serine peptidase, partial [Elusimicrobia bacterium]|nr:S8 family serine peptidase [Elusimicrobiota bacterium]